TGGDVEISVGNPTSVRNGGVDGFDSSMGAAGGNCGGLEGAPVFASGSTTGNFTPAFGDTLGTALMVAASTATLLPTRATRAVKNGRGTRSPDSNGGNASINACSSSADSGRSSGAFANNRCTSPAIGSGICSGSDGTGSSACAINNAVAVAARNG